jgi:hypothetical protein
VALVSPTLKAGVRTTVFPLVAPIVIEVAAPNAFTVVAVVLKTLNVVLPVVIPVVKTGDVPNTNAPEPVSSVIAAAKFALDGVPNQVAIPEPNEVIPVPPDATGNVPVVKADVLVA